MKAVEEKTSKFDSAIVDISKAMTAMVKFQLETETNTKHIDVLFDKVDDNRKHIHQIEKEIHLTCDIKTKELSTLERTMQDNINETEKELEHRIEHSSDNLDVRGNKRLGLGLTILAFAFGYLVTGINNKDDKIDKILSIVTVTQKDVAVLQTNQNHLMEKVK